MVLIGLISDTHDNLEAIRRAVEVFNQRKVELVLHAGDFNAPFTSAAFKGLKAKLIGVFGNVDGERVFLKQRYAEVLNGEIRGEFAEVEVEGGKLALIHGVVQPIVEALALSGRYNAVIRGHTHKQEVLKLGDTLIVNPGEACGYLTGKRTVALLDPARLEVEFVEI
ncbi:MAG: phosphoesterase, MJ0936 family [Candidatus Hecatellales archaeon B24]|nr:MAG: phosphoesterase, MJ0936 family [Candidatus Hecatellales archaeon B24]